MITNSSHSARIICTQCGTENIGRFCSNCGSPLAQGESVAGEIQSKFSTPVVGFLSFVKTVWLVFASPRAFYKSYVTGSPPLSELTFPLAGLWHLVSSSSQKVMRPFQSLATAIGLVAGIAVLQNWAWRVTGFSERVFGMTMAQMAENSERGVKAFYQDQFGRSLTIVDTAHLTGIAFIDGPAHEIIGLLQYMYFPLVVSVFLIGRSIQRATLMHFYVYAVSTSLAVFFVFNVAGLVVFLLLQAASPNAALGLSGLPVIVGHLTRAYFVAVLPVLVLPNILPISRGRMVAATLVGAAVWMGANWLLTQILVFNLGVVWTNL